MAGSPLITPGGNNAAQYFNGTSTFSSVALTLSSWNQISVSAWVWWSSFANNDDLAMEHSTSSSSFGGTWMWDPNSTSPSAGRFGFRWASGAGSGARTVVSIARPSAGQWHHVLMLGDGTATGLAALPAIYLDGVAQSLENDGALAGTTSLRNDTLYLMSRAGGSLFGQGAMAQLALFAGTLLGADDAATLADGADPRAVSTGATHFWRLDRKGPEPNLGRLGAAAGTMTTSTAGMLALPAALSPEPGIPWLGTAAAAPSPAGALGQTFFRIPTPRWR